MNSEYKTYELAKEYESQGYLQDALDIYRELDAVADGADPSLRRACTRVEAALEDAGENAAKPPKDAERMAYLLEEWLKLLILEKRLTQFERIQARLQ